jgi:hypothetical protein
MSVADDCCLHYCTCPYVNEMTVEFTRPSDPARLLDALAGPFIPGPLLGLGAFGLVQDQLDPQWPVEPVSTVGSPLLLVDVVQQLEEPPLVFHRARPEIPTRPQVAPTRPHTLGEFLAAAKSRSDALMRTSAMTRLEDRRATRRHEHGNEGDHKSNAQAWTTLWGRGTV